MESQISNTEIARSKPRQNHVECQARSFADTLKAPLLYLSSQQAGWEGLVAEAFYEPTQLQGWVPKATPDVLLIVFAGGPLHMDVRYENSPRTTLVMHEGEFILRPGMIAPCEMDWKSLSSIPSRTLHLHISQNLLSHTAEELSSCDPARLNLTEELSSCTPAMPSLSNHSGFQDALLSQIGLTLWRELEQPNAMGKIYAQTAAQMLAVHLLRHYTSAQIRIQEVRQFLTRRQVERVTDFILADLSQDLSLEALADQVGFSPYHFARLFRQTTGESPHQFVLRQRLEKAQYLLEATDTPLAHIAIESGFANQSHLTRHFKRRLGLTPKAYRQINQNTAHFYNG